VKLAKQEKTNAVCDDAIAMTNKQRARYEKKQARLLEDTPKTVPVHEQSKDLTGPEDDAIVSLQRRQEITKSARGARRRSIRESNFLKSM
jgi:large subunit ribosomal protein L54